MAIISPQKEALLALARVARQRDWILPIGDCQLELQGYPRAILLGLRHDVGGETVVLLGRGERVYAEIPGPCVFVHLRDATVAECAKVSASRVDAAELLRLEDGCLVPTGITEVFARLA